MLLRPEPGRIDQRVPRGGGGFELLDGPDSAGERYGAQDLRPGHDRGYPPRATGSPARMGSRHVVFAGAPLRHRARPCAGSVEGPRSAASTRNCAGFDARGTVGEEQEGAVGDHVERVGAEVLEEILDVGSSGIDDADAGVEGHRGQADVHQHEAAGASGALRRATARRVTSSVSTRFTCRLM